MDSATYHFAHFDLDPSLGRLCRDGRPVQIELRAFSLLCYLVEHRDRVVPSKELLDRVWKGGFVTDTVLATAVHTVRLAIGDTGRSRRLIRYDERGYGLSDWTTGFTLAEWIEDLDAVADAAGLDRFPLLGVSQGGPLAVAYAALRPERVSRLVLNAAYARGRLARARAAAEHDEAALDLKLTLAGWHAQDRSYLRFYGAQFFAESPPQRWEDLTGYLKSTVSAANGARFLEEQSRLDVSDLARRVRCPTLIVHSRDDPRIPLAQAIELADLIPGSRLVVLEGRNHLLTGDEPAWPRFLDEMYAFLAEDDPIRG